MPKTAARRLRDDLESLGAARLGDIETAQAETVRILKEMAASGELGLARLNQAQTEEQA
jgi:flagellar motor switch protein FliG